MEEKAFRIKVDGLRWIDGDPENTDDLCAHGRVSLKIGGHFREYDACVSASALYLLKSLGRDHVFGGEEQLVPCCGHCLIPHERDEFGETCDIAGCPNGIDWTVRHDGEFVRLVLGGNESVSLPFDEYKSEVFSFSDEVKAFYDASLPRDASREFVAGGWCAFLVEWEMHYRKWGRAFGGR